MLLRLLPALLCTTLAVQAGTALDSALALFKAKQFPEARAALEKITAAEPGNAAACYYLAQVLALRAEPGALDEAAAWFEKATTLDPSNVQYLLDYGGSQMQLAGRHSSLSAASRGRAAMEKVLTLDPGNLNARESLFQYYQQAPWPIGSSSKAADQLEEIRQRDPDRATVLSVIAKANAKDFDTAFQLCEEVLARQPANYTALYQYGRTAAISGLNLERGVACLGKCLTLTPPTPASPSPSNAWNRLGQLHEKLGRPAEARTDYENAVRLDPSNQTAVQALAGLK